MHLTEQQLQQSLAPVIQIVQDIRQQNADIRQQNVDIQQQNAELDSKLTIVNNRLILVESELSIIKANTIIIREHVLSDFDGIQPETKADLEAAFMLATEEGSESMQAAEDMEAYLATRPKHVHVGPIVKRVSPKATHADKSTFGNFANKVSSQLFGVRFRNKWAPDFQLALDPLSRYFFAEREASKLIQAGRRI